MLLIAALALAAPQSASRPFSQQSGASGDFYVGADFGMRWKTSDQTAIGARLGYSAEYDYSSIHLGGDYAWERDDKDANVTVSLDGFIDSITPIRFDGRTDADESRTSAAATVSWYQIFGPKTHGTIGATLATQSGFLETAYNSVIFDDGTAPVNPDLHNNAAGFETEEVVPDSRLRTVLFGRARHSMGPGRAFELGGRVYSDDWGITAFDVMPRWYQSFQDGRHLLQFRYRFYTQSEADFYQREIFTGAVPVERSQDSDLGDFSSNTVGMSWTWNKSRATRWNFSLDDSLRSEDLDNLYGSIGYRWSF